MESARAMTDTSIGRSRIFGFASMSTRDDARRAIADQPVICEPVPL
ncbi:MAG: hypothetical protein ACREJU_18790 [Nitrospiraceae bacterium]